MDKARALGLDRLALQPTPSSGTSPTGIPVKPFSLVLVAAAAAPPAGPSSSALGEKSPQHQHESMAYTLVMVQEYLRGQIAGIQARFDRRYRGGASAHP
jgi:hypothetical protein